MTSVNVQAVKFFNSILFYHVSDNMFVLYIVNVYLDSATRLTVSWITHYYLLYLRPSIQDLFSSI